MTEDGTPCRRMLRNRPYCDKHRDGNPVGTSSGPVSPRTVAGPSNLTRSAYRDAPRPRVRHRAEATVEIAHVRTAVDLVQELASEGWRRTVAQRLASHLGDEVWADVDRSWETSRCRKLARAARNVSRLDPALARFDSVLGRQSIKGAVRRAPVAGAMVDRVLAAHTQLDTVVLAMRVAGIVLCELHGCITGCQCLKDLADETGPALLTFKIAQVCDGYLV
jgi:hypothetical protein